MNEILLFLLKSVLVGSLFYGTYSLTMKKETFLAFNRYYLLASALLMVVLPMVSLLYPLNLFPVTKQATLPIITLPEIVITSNRIVSPEQESAIINWAVVGYIAITAAMFSGLVLSVFRILRFYRTAMGAEKLNNNIYLLPENGSPFSFLGKVFISKQYANHPGLESILIHENAHIRQKHIIDLILLELLSSIFWFNPFFFLIKRALREVHEYLADREVIRLGTEPLSYQQLLFNEVSGNPQYIIANNFNLLTKKRIIMLIKKSGKMVAFRIGVLLPIILTAALLIALTQSNVILAQNNPGAGKSKQTTTAKPAAKAVSKTTPVKQKTMIKFAEPKPPAKESGKASKEDDVVFTVVEEMPEFPGGDEARAKYMISSIKYPEDAKKKGVQGTVFVTFVVEADGSISSVKILRGIGAGCDEEAVRVIKGMPQWKPGKQKGTPVRVQFNMPIKFALN